MKYILSIIISVFLIGTAPAHAETTINCQTVYGGGETCQQSERVTINKKVLRSELSFQSGQTYQERDFVDHIDTKNKPYSPNQQTAFRLYVTNTSTKDLTGVKVEDLFPHQYITFVAGQGTYDTKTRTFSTTIDRLKPNETRTITIQVMTARLEQLPEGSGILCSLNQARVLIGSDVSEDNSQLCMTRTGTTPTPSVQGQTTQQQTTKGGVPLVTPTQTPPQSKGGLPIAQTPQTQKTPDTGAELLLLLGPVAGVGYYLRRKTSL